MADGLRLAQADFTFNGEPINPLLIKEFEPWLSDNQAVKLSLDIVAAHGADEYQSVVKRAGKRVVCDVPRTSPREWYGYERKGVLRDGTQVLITSHHGGGSGVFQSLLFVRFSVQKDRRMNGDMRERLVITLVDAYPLGDRDQGAIEVFPDRVVVGASQHRTEPLVLTVSDQ